MEKIEKSFGKGSIMKMGDDSVEQVEVIPTGSIALNVAACKAFSFSLDAILLSVSKLSSSFFAIPYN